MWLAQDITSSTSWKVLPPSASASRTFPWKKRLPPAFWHRRSCRTGESSDEPFRYPHGQPDGEVRRYGGSRCGRCHEGHNDDRHGLHRTGTGLPIFFFAPASCLAYSMCSSMRCKHAVRQRNPWSSTSPVRGWSTFRLCSFSARSSTKQDWSGRSLWRILPIVLNSQFIGFMRAALDFRLA